MSATARIMFARGTARLLHATPAPHGHEPAVVSIISPGTELRRMAATATGPQRPAGYMTLARRRAGGGFLLAAVPHGAAVSPDDRTALVVHAGVAIEHAAVARFQLMSAIGLARFHDLVRESRRIAVLGGGPVATGCVLELRRIGARRITVATRHQAPAAAVIADVSITPDTPREQDVVIDCTGRAADALRAVAHGGFLGLAGTPAGQETLPAAGVHRAGMTVAGMHELAGAGPAAYRATFSKVLAWVTVSVDIATARSWCRTVPADDAPALYTDLARGTRPAEPFLMLSWSTR